MILLTQEPRESSGSQVNTQGQSGVRCQASSGTSTRRPALAPRAGRPPRHTSRYRVPTTTIPWAGPRDPATLHLRRGEGYRATRLFSRLTRSHPSVIPIPSWHWMVLMEAPPSPPPVALIRVGIRALNNSLASRVPRGQR